MGMRYCLDRFQRCAPRFEFLAQCLQLPLQSLDPLDPRTRGLLENRVDKSLGRLALLGTHGPVAPLGFPGLTGWGREKTLFLQTTARRGVGYIPARQDLPHAPKHTLIAYRELARTAVPPTRLW